MNRIIKFRAWHIDKQKMGFPLDFLTIDGTTRLHNSVWEEMQNGDINNLLLMQYTGLKDKNGKEIFEGDIIKALSDYWDSEDVYQVIYEPQVAGYLPQTLGQGGFEVIGNVFENPDLLK